MIDKISKHVIFNSTFTNIPIQETINYILEQIYVYENVTPICSKLILRRLLMKHATDIVLLNSITDS